MRFTVVVFAFSLIVGSTFSDASATPVAYEYVGNTFDTFCAVFSGCSSTPGLVFTTDQYVTASVVLDITSGVAASGLTALAWSMSVTDSLTLVDLYTLSSTTPNLLFPGLLTAIPNSFAVDAEGRIISWALAAALPPFGAISTASSGDSAFLDIGDLPTAYSHGTGAWQVPEPSSLLLLGIGLAGLLTVRSRQRRVSTGSDAFLEQDCELEEG